MSELDPKVRSLARQELARILDLTLHAIDVTARDVDTACEEARVHGFFSVCVPSSRVSQASARLEESDAKVTCAITSGGADADVKRYEVEAALDVGAQIFEVAVNVGLVKDGDAAALLREMRDIIDAADERPVGIRFDPQRLRPDELELLCRLALEAGVKGVAIAGHSDTAQSIAAARQIVAVTGENFGIKVDCHSLARADIVAMLDAGATRFGIADGVRLLDSL
ncbi:MAG: deoxyribose-phosphate aldolase [Verrucomicrobiota bacterium]